MVEKNTTKTYIKEWQKAIQKEISFLKKFGGTRYIVYNGRFISRDEMFTYYFDTSSSLPIPIGSKIRLEWGGLKTNGRVLSSEGKGMIVALEKSIGELISEATLLHDPWELLENLIERLDEIKKSKQKRARLKRLMDPTMEPKHPTTRIKSNVHELTLRSKYNPVTFVWGPPGTGKTYTLARVAANKYLQEKRILVLAHSNQAVDVLLAEISLFLKRKDKFCVGDVLRYGTNSGQSLANHTEITSEQLIESSNPKLSKERTALLVERRTIKQDLTRSFSKRDSDELLEIETKLARLLDKFRQKELELLKKAAIIGTTLAKAASDSAIYEKEFDLIIVDEASMAYVPQAAFAATLGKRVIICGDFKQLPPIAASRDLLVTEWLKEDIFHKTNVADSVNQQKLHPHMLLLKEQRRMHPDISAFTNQYIYKSLVADHEAVYTNRNKIVLQTPFSGHASILLDTSYTGHHSLSEKSSNSRYNLWQLLLSFQLIYESVLGGAKSIGYVTPYRIQSNLMNLLIEELLENENKNADIIAATVHRFQGSERDVMIFDTVDAEPQSRPGMLLVGKDSERLINVAITRTRGKFIHVSNTSFIKKNIFRGKTLRQLVDHQMQHNQQVTTQKIGYWIKNQHSKLAWSHARKQSKVFQDLQSAKNSIVIAIPEGKTLATEWERMLAKRHPKVSFTLVSKQPMQHLQPNQWMDENIAFPFILIDEEILWLGQPLEAVVDVDPPFVAARLHSRKVSEFFIGQLLKE
ncbi:AAA domain-containing protein [Mesobacillus maritimus]|uniref:AAA domain-containing protein n=1 Tax=Mesobacillus maritimus TaxID=1643336 RepID=UPI00204195BE|nr:AAA domain-containing protein [Mesobacillus maritimus]MCM3584285.1 AAA domain-containing protein [Mesobacillus maritimus]